jgi:hypothetical protein
MMTKWWVTVLIGVVVLAAMWLAIALGYSIFVSMPRAREVARTGQV